MTVVKKLELPVKTEKDRMIERVTDYPQAVHDRAALKAAIAAKNVYTAYDGVCGELDSYFSHLYENKQEFIPQGEQHKRWLLTCLFGDSDDGVIFETNLDKFLHKDQMKLVRRLHSEVVHFNEAVKLKGFK